MTTPAGPAPSPEIRTVSRDLLARELLDILEETFDEHHGIYLDRDTGLFETLAGIDAGIASRPPVAGAATIAAKSAHLVLYLEVLERYIRTGEGERVDWGDVWRTVGAVTPEAWDDLRADLRAAYDRVRTLLAGCEDWDDEATVAGALGIVVHTAYHLGEVREAMGVVRAQGTG